MTSTNKTNLYVSFRKEEKYRPKQNNSTAKKRRPLTQKTKILPRSCHLNNLLPQSHLNDFSEKERYR